MVQITEKDGVVSFAVRVQPRASRDEIAGEWQDALKIRLTAPPVDDRANEALRRLLAARLNVPLSAVRIAAGGRGRTKRVEVRGVTAGAVRALAG
ncbi:MAG: DUF167 domain-containing protein [Acidobacteriia bacterium]|nr:DUF167 domain-containing protein [Terriglobia bacterium]